MYRLMSMISSCQSFRCGWIWGSKASKDAGVCRHSALCPPDGVRRWGLWEVQPCPAPLASHRAPFCECPASPFPEIIQGNCTASPSCPNWRPVPTAGQWFCPREGWPWTWEESPDTQHRALVCELYSLFHLQWIICNNHVLFYNGLILYQSLHLGRRRL